MKDKSNKKSQLNNTDAQAKKSFEDAAIHLSKFNSSDLFAVSSLLSCIEYFDTIKENFNTFFPIINSKKLSMFDKAILSSNANKENDILFTCDNLSYVFNKLNDAGNTSELDDDGSYVNYRILNLFSRISNDQFKFQQHNLFTLISRSYALYEHFPKFNKDKLSNKHKSHFVDIPKGFNDKFGLSIKEYLIISISIYMHYLEKYQSSIEFEDKSKKEILNKSEKTKFKVLYGLINNSIYIRLKLFFIPENILIIDNSLISLNEIKKYFELLSKTKKELTILQNKAPFNKGEYTYRVSPLERYPIITIKNNHTKYIIPNFHYFDSSIENIIHFSLQDLYPNNEFNETFGSIFEDYIIDMIKKSLPEFEIIPEIRYKKSRNNIDGPDITLIDSNNNALISLEIKSKNVKINTRLNPVENLKDDLERAFDALKKLPSKIDDLYQGFNEYSEWQEKINSIPKENVFCLIVIFHGVYMAPEIVNNVTFNDHNDFLKHFPYKYGIFDVETFENAIELAHEKKSKFIDLLIKHYDSSRSTDTKKNIAESFGGLKTDSMNSYLKKHLDSLLKEFNIK